ncbi:hypothetical protein L2E82_44985 [Cichorium intybus]|uniref:Uncharacterized protein n=1 Tax=Cichorium intybus TaxID=13427 RepID=A0ACB8ZSR0_CICIN|nr:hypothetical protein L2E82_44985 [Cichorium intybus]
MTFQTFSLNSNFQLIKIKAKGGDSQALALNSRNSRQGSRPIRRRCCLSLLLFIVFAIISAVAASPLLDINIPHEPEGVNIVLPSSSRKLIAILTFKCYRSMETPSDLKFEVGQLAEIKTFMEGYRGAWFRCKIKDINLRKNKIMPEYFDFPGEEITWKNIYELPHYGWEIKRQLMVRPQYPKMYHKNEMPAVNSISEVCVVIDGSWKFGDLVDWYKDDCFWSSRIVKILSDDKIKIELSMPPAGQGGIYEAFCKDIRPSLSRPTNNGQTSCNAQLIYPSQQVEMKMDGGDDVEKASSSDSISTLLGKMLITTL